MHVLAAAVWGLSYVLNVRLLSLEYPQDALIAIRLLKTAKHAFPVEGKQAYTKFLLWRIMRGL